MKKTKITAALLLGMLFCTPSFAQESEKTLSPEAEVHCSRLSRELADEIHLNESEYIVLKNLNREAMLKTAEIADTYRNDPATREKKIKEVFTKFRTDLKPILKPYQLQAFSNLKFDTNTWLVPVSTTSN